MVVMSMTIGQNIKTIRKKVGMTQKDLSSQTGISVQSIRKYESDKVIPKSQNLQVIANVLGVSPSNIDSGLKETLDKWNQSYDVEDLSSSSKMFEIMISLYGEDLSSSVNDFLENLTPEGQQKVSEYIDLLIPKFKK